MSFSNIHCVIYPSFLPLPAFAPINPSLFFSFSTSYRFCPAISLFCLSPTIVPFSFPGFCGYSRICTHRN